MIPTTFVMNKLCFTYMQYINYLPIDACKFTYLCRKKPYPPLQVKWSVP